MDVHILLGSDWQTVRVAGTTTLELLRTCAAELDLAEDAFELCYEDGSVVSDKTLGALQHGIQLWARQSPAALARGQLVAAGCTTSIYGPVGALPGWRLLNIAVQVGCVAAAAEVAEHVGQEHLDAALLSAAHHGKPEVLQLLLRCGAKVSATGERGQTALHEAAAKGKYSQQPTSEALSECAALLLEAGALHDAADREGNTPAFVAARWGNVHVLRLLIARGRPEGAHRSREALMSDAARWGTAATVQLLVRSGYDPCAPDAAGAPPIDHANKETYPALLPVHWEVKMRPGLLLLVAACLLCFAGSAFCALSAALLSLWFVFGTSTQFGWHMLLDCSSEALGYFLLTRLSGANADDAARVFVALCCLCWACAAEAVTKNLARATENGSTPNGALAAAAWWVATRWVALRLCPGGCGPLGWLGFITATHGTFRTLLLLPSCPSHGVLGCAVLLLQAKLLLETLRWCPLLC